MELRQAIGDINDDGGSDPDITENVSPYSMNATGEFIHSATYLFKPKTKF